MSNDLCDDCHSDCKTCFGSLKNNCDTWYYFIQRLTFHKSMNILSNTSYHLFNNYCCHETCEECIGS